MKSKTHKPAVEIGPLLLLLDEAYNKQAWHGPNLRGALRGLSAAEAIWRPGPGRKNVWEIALHAAYWKYTVLRRLTGAKRGSFPLAGSNWFPRDVADEEAWRAELKLLDRVHRWLRVAVAALSPAALETKPPGSKQTHRRLIQGAALHDVYHAGQVQTLKRLYVARQLTRQSSRPTAPPLPARSSHRRSAAGSSASSGTAASTP
jgi:hypothetical protein